MKFLYGPVSPNFWARRSVMMILNISESLTKPACHGKNWTWHICQACHGLFVKFKKPSKTVVVLIAIKIGDIHSPSRLSWQKLNMAYLSSLKNRAIRIDDIHSPSRLSWQKLSMAYLSSLKKPSKTVVVLIAIKIGDIHSPSRLSWQKLNMAYKKPSKTVVVLIAVKFKKPSKTVVVLIALISGTPCLRHIIVPFGAEAPSGHVAQA